jgi:hypothetical protein
VSFTELAFSAGIAQIAFRQYQGDKQGQDEFWWSMGI